MLPTGATCKEMHKYSLTVHVLVPSPPQCFRYSLKPFPRLPHLLTETLQHYALSIFIFFSVSLVKTIDKATEAHLLLSRGKLKALTCVQLFSQL